jgi:glycosyltransferase involved in cell wall biosynthesis
MKVVHFSTEDRRSGATRSALRLHHGLRLLGVDSKMLVKKKYSQDPSIIQASSLYENPLTSIVQRYYVQFQRTPITNTLFSLGYPGVSCDHEKIIQKADILILHWITDFLSPTEIDSLLKLQKPIVWVCHDMRAFTGGCHYTAGCRQFTKICHSCPQLKTDPFHVVESNFRDQLEIFQRNPITVVAPSHWMAQEARASTIFREATIKTIPYGLEENIFKATNQKEARINLGLEPESCIILLACSNAEEERKGLDYLEAISYALLRSAPKILKDDLKYKVTFLFIGTRTNKLPHLAFPSKHLDFVQDDGQLQQAYTAADVLLHLSKEDNLPNMVLEAMACGTPVVGFDTGGVSDLVIDGENGFLVPLGDIAALSERLFQVIFDFSTRAAIEKAARLLVETKFTLQHQAKAHVKLYEDLLKEQAASKRKECLNVPLRMKKIIPHLFSIAESINCFIEIERTSCAKQLESLARQYKVQNGEEKETSKKLASNSKESDYYWFIDFPQHRTHYKKCELTGWVFHKLGIPIKKIRLKIKDKIFEGSVGYSRPDVSAYFDNAKESDKSGIRIPLELSFGLNQITIEVFSKNNYWEEAFVIQVNRKILLSNILYSIKIYIKHLLAQKSLVCFFKQLFKNDISLSISNYFNATQLSGLGQLVQYTPRSIIHEKYPKNHRRKSYFNKITIVTPSYNQGQFIEATIKSVIDQKYPNLEYIVIDGGSQDESSEIINKYKPILSYCVSEKDEGQSHAIQKGFAYCTGEENDIMAYLNSDDLYLPEALQFVAHYFQKHPELDVLYGHRILIDEDEREIGRWFTPRHHSYNFSILDYVPQETMFWRKRLYDKVGGIDPSFHFAMDWDLLLRFQEAGAVIKRAPYFLGCFRVHTNQKTSTYINSVGEIEVQKLRYRSHGQKISPEHITKIHNKNSMESAFTKFLFAKGIRI